MSARALAPKGVPAPLAQLPNALTLARLALVPIFVVVLAAADGGYSWVAGQDLILAPTLSNADQSKSGTLDLGTLAPRGGFFRISVALSY